MGSFISTSQHDNFESLSSKSVVLHTQVADDYRRQVSELIRENHALKNYNKSLRNEQHKLNLKVEQLSKTHTSSSEHLTQNKTNSIKTSISTEHIKHYVDEMLKNQDINIYGFPDVIEKQIYRNVFNMLLNILDHTLDTSEVVLFGHKIVFDVKPLDVPTK